MTVGGLVQHCTSGHYKGILGVTRCLHATLSTRRVPFAYLLCVLNKGGTIEVHVNLLLILGVTQCLHATLNKVGTRGTHQPFADLVKLTHAKLMADHHADFPYLTKQHPFRYES